MSRPVPVPTELTRPFWEGTRRGELLIPRCADCGTRFFVPEPVCPGCLSADWSYEPSSGRGAVYSVTVVHRAPGPGFEVPFALAVIDLDDGGDAALPRRGRGAALGGDRGAGAGVLPRAGRHHHAAVLRPGGASRSIE
nr:hypothetical protein GCM10010200_111690 [Actinomadura rugatobispora]